MESLIVFLIVFYLVAFVYDKTIDHEIKNNQALASKLTEFKYFYSFQSRPKALSAALSFQFRGISMALTLVGSVFSLMMYFGLLFGVYYILQA